MTNDGGPAFPSQQRLERNEMWNQTYEPGISFRQYVAAHVMAGYAASEDGAAQESETLARWAVADADALIAELEKSS